MLHYNYVYSMYILIKTFDILFYVSEKQEIYCNELKCRQHFPRKFLHVVS